ncbi:MAG: hypothetical protein Q7R45_14805, partial [Sulfuricaulis sp.]|nr:hypothetical protein [Sulfuricaulis sp.]
MVAGGIANSPIDKAPLKATCADGTDGGTGLSDKGTYSMTVSCATTNFPVVISIDDTKIDNNNPPMMAGADLQFCSAAETTAGSCDDVPYKSTERAPLKVAVEDSTAAASVVNMNAITTLAAQPIEDKIKAGIKPVATDVQTAESNIQTSLGVASVKNSDPVRDSQVARINSQVLEAVAVTKQLSASTVKPEDVMKALAAAANTGTGLALTKTETDGSKSFDIATAQTALTAAAAALTGTDATSVALKASVNVINTSFTDTKAVEASIRSKGNAVEQVVKVIAGIPSMQAFDPLKNTLATGTIAADIKAALAGTGADNLAAKAATINAGLVTQAMSQAITKAQQIEADTSILTSEKNNRKKAVFDAAEAIRSSVERDVALLITAAPTGAITANQQAQAMAQVSMAVNMAGDQMKTQAIGNIVDNSGKSKPSVAGMAEKISSDIAGQFATSG